MPGDNARDRASAGPAKQNKKAGRGAKVAHVPQRFGAEPSLAWRSTRDGVGSPVRRLDPIRKTARGNEQSATLGWSSLSGRGRWIVDRRGDARHPWQSKLGGAVTAC